MNAPFSHALLVALVAVLIGAGVGVLAYGLSLEGSAGHKQAARYIAHLDRTLRVLFLPERGSLVAKVQLGAGVAIVAAALVLGLPYWPILVGVVAAVPSVHLARERTRRVAQLENQVDGFVVSFANSLKSVPSPAAALQATVTVLPQPTRQEIEQVLREMRVGSTLEQGLIAMSARIRSRSLDVALSAVLVGLRVGGNLPAVLERTAATIREMNRLLGVVRTKTSDARMQLWVLACCPLVLVGAFNMLQPGYFTPLQQTFVGQLAIGVALVLWVTSILVARKVMAVDL